MQTTYYFRSVENPNATPEGFTHYEIQSVRDYSMPDGSRFTEPTYEPEDNTPDAPNTTSPVYFGVYGRHAVGGVEHLFDRATAEEALDTLGKMIGTISL